MPQKIFTVTWSRSVTMDVPEHLVNTDVDDFDAYNPPKEIQEIATKAVQQASQDLSWKDGAITDVQDVIDV